MVADEQSSSGSPFHRSIPAEEHTEGLHPSPATPLEKASPKRLIKPDQSRIQPNKNFSPSPSPKTNSNPSVARQGDWSLSRSMSPFREPPNPMVAPQVFLPPHSAPKEGEGRRHICLDKHGILLYPRLPAPAVITGRSDFPNPRRKIPEVLDDNISRILFYRWQCSALMGCGFLASHNKYKT